MDLSLDDIIKTKGIRGVAPSKKFFNNGKNAPYRKPLRLTTRTLPNRISDARQKIIQNNRAKIRDARDKLIDLTRASGDARHRLQRRQQQQYIAVENSLKARIYRNGQNRNGIREYENRSFPKPLRRTAPLRSRPKIVEVPRGYVDFDNMERMEEEEYAAATRLSRTVTNDEMEHYSNFGDTRDPDVAAPRRNNTWASNTAERFDPFDVYELPMNARNDRRDRHISIDQDMAAPPPPKGILRPSTRQRSPTDDYDRRYPNESSSQLSYEMRTRLERAPDPHASMGIFAKEVPSSHSGYRIVVSNLHASVTESDIAELFSDIGELYDSRIVRPGVAEVIYKSLTDADKAVDTYHNRQLDGLPMKCLLVNPRASSKPTAPAIKTSSTSNARTPPGKTPLEIDIDALHKVLFRRH